MTVSPQEEFTARLAACVEGGTFVRLTLGKPRGGDPTLQKILNCNRWLTVTSVDS